MMDALERSIELRILKNNLRSSFEKYLKSENFDEELLLTALSTLNKDFPRTKFPTHLRSKEAHAFVNKVLFYIFKESKICYVQGMIEWLFVLVYHNFGGELSNLNLSDEEKLLNFDINKDVDTLSEYKCVYVFNNQENMEVYDNFIMRNNLKLKNLMILTFYYNSKFSINNDRVIKRFKELIKPVFASLGSKAKPSDITPDIFLGLNLNIYVCWFVRKISNMEHLYKIYSKIIDEGTIESIFVIYYSLIKKYKEHPEDLDIGNSSLSVRMSDFETLYNDSKVQFDLLKTRVSGISESRGFFLTAVVVSCCALIISTIYKLFDYKEQPDTEDGKNH